MEIYIKDQLVSCLAFLVLGILFGILYDIFRILCLFIHRDVNERDGNSNAENTRRNLCLTERIFRFICDIIFGVAVSVLFSVVSYAFSYGQFRMASLICASAGFAAYILTVGRLVMFSADKLVHAVKFACFKIIYLIFMPITGLIRLVMRFGGYVFSHTVGRLYCRMKSAGNKKRIMMTLEREIPKNVRFD